MARGATWMLGFRATDRALAFISTIILARALVPADFGLVAMATSVIALIELLSAFSLEVALIQRARPERGHYDTTWTLRLLLVALVAAVTAALAYPAAGFYKDPRIAPLLLMLAINMLLGGFENIGVIDFRRELDFRREFIFMMSKRAAAMPVTLVIALTLHTYWALVLGVAAGTLASVVASYVMSRYRPRISFEKWRELLSFSSWLFLFNLLEFVKGRLSHFTIGPVHGAGALGIYTVATDVAALASSEITAPINRAVMPGLSRMGEQQHGVREGLLRVTAAVLLVTLPAGAGLAAVAEPLVLTLLGSKWLQAVPVLQLLALAGALQSFTANSHSAYLASARAHVSVIVVGAYVVVLAPLMLALISWGVVGVALAHVGASMAALAVSVGLLRRHIGTTAGALLSVAWRPLVAALLMGIAVHLVDRGVASFGWPAFVRLAAGVCAGVVVYVGLVWLLWLASGRSDSIERTVADRLRAWLHIQLRRKEQRDTAE